MTAAQITALAVLFALSTSLRAALACATSDSDPGAMLGAAARNAAGYICSELECIAEGL